MIASKKINAIIWEKYTVSLKLFKKYTTDHFQKFTWSNVGNHNKYSHWNYSLNHRELNTLNRKLTSSRVYKGMAWTICPCYWIRVKLMADITCALIYMVRVWWHFSNFVTNDSPLTLLCQLVYAYWTSLKGCTVPVSFIMTLNLTT